MECGHLTVKKGKCKIILVNGACRIHKARPPKPSNEGPRFLARVFSRDDRDTDEGDSTLHITGTLKEIEDELAKIISDPKGWMDDGYDDEFFDGYVHDMRESFRELEPINPLRPKKTYVIAPEAQPAYIVHIHEL